MAVHVASTWLTSSKLVELKMIPKKSNTSINNQYKTTFHEHNSEDHKENILEAGKVEVYIVVETGQIWKGFSEGLKFEPKGEEL